MRRAPVWGAKAASAVQVQRVGDEVRSGRGHFEPLVERQSRADQWGWQVQPAHGHVHVLLQNLGGEHGLS